MLEIQENIDKLMINKPILSILKNQNINEISQLLKKTKTELRSYGLDNKDIQHIEAKAELEGFRLKGSL